MEDDPETIGGIPIRTESIGFSAGELIACGRCARTNPPNRVDCFYCGGSLESRVGIDESISLKPSAIEAWEPGVNIVVTGGLHELDPQVIEASIAIDAHLAAAVSALEPPFPVFRVRWEEADEVRRRSARLGLSITCVEDRSLLLRTQTVRLKGMMFGEKSITFHPFNSDVASTAEISEVVLIVAGTIVTTTAESKLKKTRKETKEFDEHLSSSDHTAIDIYTSSDEVGFRILPHGFDFSCLGDKKSLIAGENMKMLLDVLRKLVPDGVFDRSYSDKSAILDRVWPRTVANTSKGITRNWFGVQRATGSTTSNEEQFTRYSRMRRKLI